MKMKTYIAPTMSEAMDQLRHELGENAILVSTQRLGAGAGVGGVNRSKKKKENLPPSHSSSPKTPPPPSTTMLFARFSGKNEPVHTPGACA